MILKMTKAQVGALKECIDFLSNGYIIVWAYITKDRWTIFLLHRRNGNKMSLVVNKHEYRLSLPLGDERLKDFTDDGCQYDFDVDSKVLNGNSESWECLRRKLIFASEVGYINVCRNKK